MNVNELFKSILYIIGSVSVFFAGVVSYGFILNLREVPLDVAMQQKGISELEDVYLVIDRSKYTITLYSGDTEVKTYKASFGKNRGRIKRSKDDHITPIGDYQVCDIKQHDIFYKIIKLNYPNRIDASESLRRGYISERDFNRIIVALESGDCPDSTTVLGADIGIHGLGKYDIVFRNLPFVFNWTNGSVAVSNRNIDELSSVVEIGTRVEIIH